MPSARRDLTATASVVFGIDLIFAFGGHGVEYPLTTVEVYLPRLAEQPSLQERALAA